MKKNKWLVLVVTLLLSVVGCSNKEKIVIGTMAQPGEPILKYVERKFEEKTGYDLVIKIFTEFATPNNALAAGEIQANLFQHQPFLDTYNQTNQTDLVAACIMYDCAYGGYTKKDITTLDEIPEGKTITIANDASNMKRCLDLLQQEGLIEVDYQGKDVNELNPDNIQQYITKNEKNLVIKPISTSLIASSLDDKNTYLGIVNATFAIAAGLGQKATLLCQEEDPTHSNANILAIQKKDQQASWLLDLVEILTSEDTDQFVKQTFGSTVTPYHG